MVIVAGPGVASAIRNQFNTVTDAIGSGTAGENFYDAVDLPDPENGTAFAVYSEDDHSLMFYKRRGVPKVGDMFNYRTVTEVYMGFETEEYATRADVPWKDVKPKIIKAEVVDKIRPVSMARWFDMADVKDPGGNYCSPLTKIDIDRVDMSRCRSLRNLLQCCILIEQIDGLTNLDTSNVKDMGAVFSNCSTITNLNLSRWDTSNVTSMFQMFDRCTSLNDLDLSGWNTSNVINMYGMFAHCSSLSDVSFLSSFDTSNVTDMSFMFNRCPEITDLYCIKNWNTSGTATFYAMFIGCSNLKTLNLSSWNTSNATDMSWMFANCSKLSNIAFPDFSTSKATNLKAMFYGCSLLSLDCSGWNVNAAAEHDNFNAYAPGVTLPKVWQ